jgi:hypothetical protein
MARNALMLFVILAVSACAPLEQEDGFSFDGEREVETIALKALIGQSADEVAVGDWMEVYLLSDPGASTTWYDENSFLACDAEDWSIEHEVTTYVASMDPVDVDMVGDLDEILSDETEGSIISMVGFVIAPTVRTGDQILMGSTARDFYFDVVVVP